AGGRKGLGPVTGGAGTPGGDPGDIQINVLDTSFGGLGGDPDVIIRRNGTGTAWITELPAELPVAVEDDVFGSDGVGGIKNLGPMTGGGGDGESAGIDGDVQLSDGALKFKVAGAFARHRAIEQRFG